MECKSTFDQLNMNMADTHLIMIKCFLTNDCEHHCVRAVDTRHGIVGHTGIISGHV